MSIADKLKTIAENEQKIYDKGMSDKESEFWDIIQQYGARKAYQYAFFLWRTEYIRPKYKVEPTEGSASNMFYGNSELKKIEKEYFDLSKLPKTTYASMGNYYTCFGCNNLEEIEDIGMPVHYYTNTFHNCHKLKTLTLNVSEETVQIMNAFHTCISLENVIVNGVIPVSINFQYSPLSVESMKNVISHLKPNPTNGCTLTFTADCWSRLEASGKPYQEEWTQVTDETMTWNYYVTDVLGWDT